jgi:signal peptidase I
MPASAAARFYRMRTAIRSPPHRRRSALRTMWPLAVLALLVGLTLVFVAEPVRVSSDSMAPTFHAGDHVLVAKVGARSHHPHRRDVIAFHLPGSSDLLIKRVVAVGGNSVGIADGVLVVNGRPVHESFVDYNLVDATYFGPVRVPRDTVFVMGDNRSNSIDSRRFGPVPVSDILGRVVLAIWPP